MSTVTFRRFGTEPVIDARADMRGEPSWLSQHPARPAITSDSWSMNLRDTEDWYMRGLLRATQVPSTRVVDLTDHNGVIHRRFV